MVVDDRPHDEGRRQLKRPRREYEQDNDNDSSPPGLEQGR